MGLGVALHDAEQRQVDEAAGEGHADAHVEDVHEHVGEARVDAVHHVHGGGHEQEGEFQRLGDAGEHGGQRRRDEQAAHHLTLFRLGGAVHGQRRAGQAKDHQRELAGHETGGFHREHLGALGGQLREEDVLRALHGDAVHHGGAAHRGLPEGNVEHVMQAEGNEGAFRHAVDPGAHVAGTDDQIAQQRDGVLDHRPDVEHGDAHHQEHGGGDDGNEPGAAEEGKHLRQLDFIEPVVQRRHAKADDDAAEHAHLQGGDAQHGGGGVDGHGLHAALRGNHGADGGVHHEVGDGAGQRGHFLFLFGHADGNAHGEQQGQVAEDGAAALVHDVQHGVDGRALVDDAVKAVGLQHGGVGEGAADTQQQTRHRQQSDGQHKGPPHALQHAENLVFHRNLLNYNQHRNRCYRLSKKSNHNEKPCHHS